MSARSAKRHGKVVVNAGSVLNGKQKRGEHRYALAGFPG
jgi:hypothetical protein